MTVGVVLMTYGAPSDDDDLPRYLSAVRGGRALDDALVAEMRRRYAAIGGSPLVRITIAQAAALERTLGARWPAAAGMRFSQPTIAEAVSEVVRRGAERIVGICMSPQWSPLLMGGYARELAASCERAGVAHALAETWHREPSFIASLAASIRDGLAQSDAFVLLTAHSLPRRVFEAEPEYIAQLKDTGERVAAAAGLEDGRWAWAYQSAGHTHEEWLRPDLVDLFPTIGASGATDVLVAPVQFLADHLEVLYDLDVAAAEQARAAGLRYRRIAMPNTRPSFIRALGDVARRTAASALSSVA